MPRPIALVTGASAGIGRHLARGLAAEGHDLVVVARRQDRLEQLAQELADAFGVDVQVIAADLADPHSAQAIIEPLAASGRDVDVLVNNAGFGTHGPFHEQPVASQLAMIQVNVSTLVHLTAFILPGMVQRRRGRVLNIASVAGFQPGPMMATYFATKAFVVSFSEAIAHEVRGTGVTVTAHCPGATNSEFAVTAGNDRSRLFAFGAASSDAVAQHALSSMKAGQVVAVHGLQNQMVVLVNRFMPRVLVRSVTAWVNGLRNGSPERRPGSDGRRT